MIAAHDPFAPAARPPLTDDAVWRLVSEGCNDRELADYFGVSLTVARSWMAHAARLFRSDAAAQGATA